MVVNSWVRATFSMCQLLRACHLLGLSTLGACQRDWYVIAEQPEPAPPLAHLEGCAALHIVLATVPLVSRSCEYFPDGFGLHHLQESAEET